MLSPYDNIPTIKENIIVLLPGIFAFIIIPIIKLVVPANIPFIKVIAFGDI